ncbi:tryptophan-rich sensory protein [Deinococcus wulumuqiensis]|uniref:Tryptophan-rich sensory protein n=1 Tax=Deinococcus wulumuqiensis TaxID=980427 RepID=A0A345IEU5_9DEIO|nr:tryptophan-rich sensory protein [Deinococcus wulumuqiensis]AXG98217.1 tryptophan-rich sensory protein [Deinococcus wulumuqiensis]
MTGLARQVTLLAATVLTLVINYLSNALPLFGNSNAEVSDRLPNAFTPAGLTFAVWGPIFLGLLVFAVYQALPAQRGARLDRLFWPFLLGNLLNVAWLLAFQSLNIGLSVVIMLALLAVLVRLYLSVRSLPPQGAERWTLQLPVSLYLAWISVATIANITAFLVSAGVTQSFLGIAGPVWSALLLVVAAAIGVFFLWRFRDYAFAAVLLWAFYGVYVARPEVSTVVLGVAVAAGLVLLGSLSAWRRPRAAL